MALKRRITMDSIKEENTTLTPGQLSFIGLSNEYCQSIESVRETTREEFIANMLRLLPRLYIVATDLPTSAFAEDSGYIEASLDEDYYDSARRGIEDLLGMDDTYLEVFEEDMKYSDTPIGASISEGLCDIFQSLYNFLEMVKDSPVELIISALDAAKEEFESYWSRILCNNLRAINNLRYNG